MQSRPWSEMAPRVGEDRHPVWCRFIPEAHSMMVPFQIRSQKPYPIRAMLAFGLNYRMWPGSDFARESFKKLDFMVDVDLFMTDTAKLADVVLPACSSYERSELKFYPEKKILWTRPAIEPLGQSRSDADIIFDLAETLTPDDNQLREGYEASVDWILEPSGFKVAELKKYPRGLVVDDVSIPPYRKPEADVNTLIDPDYRDPISGFPGFKSLLCEVKKAPD